jgi:hypothetical protein
MSSGSDLLDQPVTLADAAREMREAHQRVRTHARGYDRIRRGTSAPAIARARAEWGLSVYEWAQATIAQAEAEDRRNLSWRIAPALGALSGMPQPAQPEAGERTGARDGTTLAQAKDDLAAACARRDTCWRAYAAIHRRIDAAEAIGHARARWADALAAWVLALVAHAEKEDQHHIEERQRRQERAMQLHPDDALGRSLTAAEEAVHQARERIRQQNIERDRRPYGP